MRASSIFLVAAALAAAGCTRPSPLYCDESTPCSNSSIPFCDLDGVYQSDTHRCIENPFGHCQLPGDCTEASAPICDQFIGCAPCTAIANGNAACIAADPATPICEPSGVCGGCSASDDCDATAPICNTDSLRCEPCTPGAAGDIACTGRDPSAPLCSNAGACAECLAHNDCTDALREFCGEDGFCRGCIDNHECESGVCDRDAGTCASEDDIAYVQPLADGDCTKASPCGRIGGPEGALSVKSIVKLAAGTYAENTLTLTGDWIIGESGAVISGVISSTFAQVSQATRIEDLTWNGNLETTCNTNGDHALTLRNVVMSGEEDVLVRVRKPCHVEIHDSLLRSTTQRAVDASRGTTIISGSTLSSTENVALHLDGGEVIVRRSIFEHSRVGIDAPLGDLVISESEIRHNTGLHAVWLAGSDYDFRSNVVWGNEGSGVEVVAPGPFVDIFEFNTVAFNGGTGVLCYPGGSAAPNNIVWGNGTAEVAGGCAWSFSNIEGGNAGEGNIDEDPLFLAPASGDFHLRPGSPCIGAGNPNSSNSTDIDGDLRPYGGAFDIGADEFRP